MLSDNMTKWLANGQRGISSNTIMSVCTGLPTNQLSHPWDPDDLSRCVLLLEQCPEIVERFKTLVPLLSAEWRSLVSIWDDLVATFDAECPEWRSGRWESAPRTYAKMQDAIRGGATR